MKPSLDGAYARISRAEEHIERLKREEPTTIFDDTDWEPERYGSLALRETDVAGTIISILVGEIVYNLRAALDYLVYELAFLDSGSIQDGTQFPIEDTKSRFDAHKTWRIKPRRNKPGKPGYIQFLNAAHQAAIERLQPYPTRNWLARLRDISNPDKHRKLILIRRILKRDTATFIRTPKGMSMQSEVTFGIAFDDGEFATETLDVLKSEVRAVIDSFKPEF
jgi:hypothetical protein